MTTLRDRQETFARTLALFLNWMLNQGYHWTMGDCWRSTDELLCCQCGMPITYQELLRFNGRSKTLQSKHADRLAIDLNLFIDGKMATPDQYRPLGEKWEQLGGRWGGRFSLDPSEYATKVGFDPPHFEM